MHAQAAEEAAAKAKATEAAAATKGCGRTSSPFVPRLEPRSTAQRSSRVRPLSSMLQMQEQVANRVPPESRNTFPVPSLSFPTQRFSATTHNHAGVGMHAHTCPHLRAAAPHLAEGCNRIFCVVKIDFPVDQEDH